MHKCKYAVIACIDFRFRKFLNKFLNDNYLENGYDYISIAGGVKDLEYISKQLDISKKLHGINNVIFINHEDCGSYGKEGTFEKHKEDLFSAKKMILEKYPDLCITLLYLSLNGDFKEV